MTPDKLIFKLVELFDRLQVRYAILPAPRITLPPLSYLTPLPPPLSLLICDSVD